MTGSWWTLSIEHTDSPAQNGGRKTPGAKQEREAEIVAFSIRHRKSAVVQTRRRERSEIASRR